MEVKPKITTLVTGLNFPEGPCFDAGGKLWFTECRGGSLTCFADGKLARLHAGGKPGCMVFDAAGDIWFTEQEDHKIRKYLQRQQRFEDVLDNLAGMRLNRPNDLAFDPAGNLVFSCHADARTEPLGYLVSFSKDGVAKVISSSKYFTNGVVFTKDGNTFYFSETYKQRVWRATWNSASATILKEEPFMQTPGPIGPDGLALDVDGNLYVTVFDQSRILVAAPDGKIIETIMLPVKRPTSCAFDPSGRFGLVVTDADVGCVLSIDLGRKGENIFFR
ncbi:MAG: SMP-30/gluconolactonase/LRE family protein [Verrucomicrobiota bacterium]